MRVLPWSRHVSCARAAREWGVQAWILRRRGDHQLLKLELDSIRHAGFLRAEEPPSREVYDSMVEESFAILITAIPSVKKYDKWLSLLSWRT